MSGEVKTRTARKKPKPVCRKMFYDCSVHMKCIIYNKYILLVLLIYSLFSTIHSHEEDKKLHRLPTNISRRTINDFVF